MVFKVKDVPAFYIPYFIYPSRRTSARRASSSRTSASPALRGFNIGGGFFWAMGRSYDQTFYVDHYSKFG